MKRSMVGAGLALALLGVVALAQREARKDPPAPTDRIMAWSAAEMQAVNQQMAASKELTHRFFGEKTYNMEVRRLVGPQSILQHAKKNDFMVIQDGEGTFMTGGELVNGKAGGEDAGDLRGEAIKGGSSRVLKPGDVVFVPSGLPHGFVETKDHVTFVMMRFDAK